MSGVTAGLRALLGKLVAHKVDFEDERYEGNDHHEEPDLNKADVISSMLKPAEALKHPTYRFKDGTTELEQILDLHQIVIDIDHRAYLVDSTTPGHHHLYVELSNPVSTEAYFEWLEACAKVGLVEPGYVSAFKVRGFSCVRLPWVQKPGVAATRTSPPWPAAPVPQHSPEIPVEDLGGL